jgi:Mg-chelatase subunit ChlD
MRTAITVLIALVCLTTTASAQQPAPVPDDKIKAILNEGLETVLVVVADTSGSMRDRPQSGGWSPKIDISREALTGFVRRLPEEVELAMITFWGCHVRWMAQPAQDSRPAIARELGAMQPRGSTPIAMSLEAALTALKAKREKNPYGRYMILLLTDGEETCSTPYLVGETATKIAKAGIELQVIGFDLPSQDTELKKIGTKYYLASDSKELEAGLQSVQGELELDATVDAVGGGH